MNLESRIAKNALVLLKRVPLKGEEVPLFAEVQIALERIAREEDAPKGATTRANPKNPKAPKTPKVVQKAPA